MLLLNNSHYNYFIAPDELEDTVMVEGDILLDREQAAIYKESGWDGLIKAQTWDPYKARWSKNIPYINRVTGIGCIPFHISRIVHYRFFS